MRELICAAERRDFFTWEGLLAVRFRQFVRVTKRFEWVRLWECPRHHWECLTHDWECPTHDWECPGTPKSTQIDTYGQDPSDPTVCDDPANWHLWVP